MRDNKNLPISVRDDENLEKKRKKTSVTYGKGLTQKGEDTEYSLLVLVNYFLRNVAKSNSHLFEAIKRRVEVHVGDVHSHPFRSRCGEHAIPVDLDCLEACRFGADVSRVVGY